MSKQIVIATRTVSPGGLVHEISDWFPMDVPVGPAMLWAGPTGEFEVDADRWRMHRFSTLSADLNPEGD